VGRINLGINNHPISVGAALVVARISHKHLKLHDILEAGSSNPHLNLRLKKDVGTHLQTDFEGMQ
jgi:hypothetical protein